MKESHGHRANGVESKEYRAWREMRRRCEDESRPYYKDYGGRGISVCKEWSSFIRFLSDVGVAPGPEFTLNRIDNDGHYEPGNVEWATWSEQASNRRTFKKRDVSDGFKILWREGVPVKKLAKLYKVRTATIYTWIRKCKKAGVDRTSTVNYRSTEGIFQ